MTVPASVENLLGNRLDPVLARMAAQVHEALPEAGYAVHHGGNERFPAWVVARFSNGDKVVDVSVECQWRDARLEIRVDVARENGFVLQEYSTILAAAPSEETLPGGRLEETLQQVESFLLQQVDGIRQELS